MDLNLLSKNKASTQSQYLGTHKVTTIPTGMEDGPEMHWDT